MPKVESPLRGYVTEKQPAKMLDVCRRTLQRWRSLRMGPPLTKLGAKLFYAQESVRKWLAAQEQPDRSNQAAPNRARN